MKTITKPKRKISTEMRRRQILDAALECFLKNGVENTTIDQIQKLSKASNGSIYHLFQSKNEIAMTLFVEGMETYHKRLLTALQKKKTARTKIHSIIKTHLEGISENPHLALYLSRLGTSNEFGEIGKQYRLLHNGFVEAVWDNLRNYVEQDELVRLPKELYFSLIIGPASHLSRCWLRGQIEGDLLSYAGVLANAAYHSLQARE